MFDDFEPATRAAIIKYLTWGLIVFFFSLAVWYMFWLGGAYQTGELSSRPTRRNAILVFLFLWGVPIGLVLHLMVINRTK